MSTFVQKFYFDTLRSRKTSITRSFIEELKNEKPIQELDAAVMDIHHTPGLVREIKSWSLTAFSSSYFLQGEPQN